MTSPPAPNADNNTSASKEHTRHAQHTNQANHTYPAPNIPSKAHTYAETMGEQTHDYKPKQHAKKPTEKREKPWSH
jgi:hypothetical protein